MANKQWRSPAATDLATAYHKLVEGHTKVWRAKREWESILDCLDEMVLLADRQGRVVRCNQAFACFLVRPFEEVNGRGWEELLREQGLVREISDNGLAEYSRPADGRVFCCRTFPFAAEYTEIRGTVVILQDVTERQRIARELQRKNSALQAVNEEIKASQAKLLQQEKLASIGQLAAGVAHEINNPLGVIKCYANLIRRQLSSESAVLSDVEVIQRHTDHCKSVVEALLSFARVSEPRKMPVDLNACIEEVLAMIMSQAGKGNVEVEKDLCPDLPAVVSDLQQMKQVFMNLILNALQAMPEGGRLTLTSRVDADQRHVEVKVADTGRGIGEKNIDRIFDPFFTTKEEGKGTGLGLSVSYGIVCRHGGEISVESRPGRGAAFFVYLPIEDVNHIGKGQQ